MKAETDTIPLTHVHEHVIRTLVYYDIFNYPLTADEVVRFLGLRIANADTVTHALRQLKQQGSIYQFGNFYSLQNNIAAVARRTKGNGEATRYLALARSQARFIARFPFVRAVLASGSLAKGYMDEKSDLDFFIITASNRLWIARTLLVMYKRIFLLNDHKYFCVNYFIAEDHLAIEDRNLFTATELATAIPLYGAALYHRLHDANTWLASYFPNYRPRTTAGVPGTHTHRLKRILENVLTIMATALEKYFLRITRARWQRLYRHGYTTGDFEVAFKSKAHVSKNHPRNFQRKVLDIYAQKLKAYGVAIESD